ncbi:MAG: polyprenyl synthetase family protein [Candidatus Gastranaerophilales bacterium]|nr:polyprenyl synthetase family protein [Candidatus Gastranaerophilales bacterium]
MQESVKEKFNQFRKKVDEGLDKYVEVIYPESIYESMKYSLLAGGKRLRPVMACEIATALGASVEEIIPTACAIEMLHCQSLIHDDLPCMDNDDYRRGKLTNHKVFGESTAVLAGDALLSFAPKLIIDKTPSSVSSDKLLNVLREFFIAAGVDGIISGQIVDIDSEHKKISKETLSFIYEYKTAKLFKLAVRAGAIIAGATEKQIEDLTKFAEYYGHAFQIYDDILDVTSTLEELGKTPGKDANVEKSTYVSMYGLDEAKKQALFLCNKACDILKSNDIKSDILYGVVSEISEGIGRCS